MNNHHSLPKYLAATVVLSLLIQTGMTQVNYVRAFDAKAPEQNANTLITRPLRDVQQTTQYFDGLGRPMQTVVKQGSFPTGGIAKDLVSPIVYDAFGREAQKYLPYAASSSDGLLKPVTTVLTDQAAFYNSTSAASPISGQGDTYFYAQTNFEASPLNRVTEQFAPGNNWVGTAAQTAEANRRSVKIKYYTNTATDTVRIWNVPDAMALGSWSAAPTSTAAYAAGTLYKTITVDERGKQVIEFKDKAGKVILKKVQLTGSDDTGAGKGYSGWMCTYYIYDDLGNLRCVIQPEGVKTLAANGWTVTTTISDHQCFRYEYDQRNRMILKKVPGVTEANAVWMVYDIRDRLVMTQDGKQRNYSKKAWIVTHYDALNRPIQTGYYTNNHSTISGKTFLQILVDAADQIDYPFAPGAAPSSSYYVMLTMTGYDHYDYITNEGWSLTKDIDNAYNTYLHATYNTAPLYAQQPVQSFQTQGLVTWTKIKLSGANYFEYTVNIYDDKARLIQVKHRNYTGGTSVTTTQYNWMGQPLRVVHRHHKALNTTQVSIAVTNMTYDDLGRLTLTQKKIRNNLVNSNAQPAEWTTIAANEYDALGQLKTKKLGKKRNADGSYSSNPLATLEYAYNIRGWLLSINKNYINNSDADRYFAMELGYDKDHSTGSNATKQYNGNIGSILWKSAGDHERRKYDFTYDAANRLTGAAFGQYASGSGASAVFNTSAGIDFSVNGLGYDYNGNITAMTQYGLKLNTSAPIDKLIYTYEPGTNRLQKVAEDGTITAATNGQLGDFKDGTNTDADYAYNQNGSITKDQNKGISDISYHSGMELPQIITTSKGTVEFMYDYTGEKCWKKTIDNSDGSKSIRTDTKYVENFVYESKTITPTDATNPDYSDKLLFAAHEEGRIRPIYTDPASPNSPKGFVYDYFIKDHLGNIRMVITDELKQDIYPAATLEGSITTDGSPNAVYKEKEYYNINSSYIVDKTTATGITDYTNSNGTPVNNNPNSATTANSAKLYKLNSNTNKTGLGITLKVMAGDRIDIFGKSYYFQNNTGGTGANSAIPVLDILTGLLGSPTGSTAAATHGGITASQLNGVSNTTSGINTLLSNQTSNAAGAPTVPKAYINYILFDDQFKTITTGFSKVGSNSTVKSHTDLTNIPVTKSGFVYIYVSNESPVNVFFDNLQVVHTRGAILEENSFYPFGLTMQGISSRALNGIAENKIKFQGQELASKEFRDGSGLEWYEFKYRMADPQIGRFHALDPLADKYVYNSPYAFSENKVISYRELEGLEAQLAIAGNGNNTSYKPEDINAFKARADKLGKSGFTVSQVRNGDQLVDQLKQGTTAEGSVGAVVIFAHASQQGIYLDKEDGFYSENDWYGGNNSSNVSELKGAVNAGEVKFDENAVFVFGACNCGKEDGTDPLAISLTKELGVATVAATGSVYPEIVDGKETGRLLTDGTFKMNKMVGETTFEIPGYGNINIPAGIGTTNLGKVIDPIKLVPKKSN